MNEETIKQAIAEGERFIAAARAYLAAEEETRNSRWRNTINPRESGALRRSSMDLSRKLADLRQNR